jgi:nucleoside 2-deoxyribosyltransferase
VSRRHRVYVASPLGFSEAGRDFYRRRLVPHLRRLGYRVLDPWSLTSPRRIAAVTAMRYGSAKRAAWARLNREIGATNRRALAQADGVLAVLDGTDVDSGTAAEIGYAVALGKPVVGYRGDFRLSADNEGALVNLQVEYFIRVSGGTIVTRTGALAAALRRALGAGRRSPGSGASARGSRGARASSGST